MDVRPDFTVDAYVPYGLTFGWIYGQLPVSYYKPKWKSKTTARTGFLYFIFDGACPEAQA